MHQPSEQQHRLRRLSVAVVGDSLAFGLGAADPSGGLIQRIFREIRRERAGSTITNHAVPHATMGDVLRHQVHLLSGKHCDVVFVIAGANDLRYTRDRFVFVRRFQHLLDAVHEAAPRALIVVGGMPDVTQTVAVHKIVKPAVAHLCFRLNETMRRIAAQAGYAFIDLFLYTNAPLCPQETYLCDDGYHPNDFGYAEIAGRAAPAILEALRSLDTATTAYPGDGFAETPNRS